MFSPPASAWQFLAILWRPSITVILLDTLNTRWTDQSFARAQVVKFLQQIQPGDHIGIYTLGSSLRVLHDYTSDSTDLLRRLASYKNGPLPDIQGGEPTKGMDGDALMLDPWPRGQGASGYERDIGRALRVASLTRKSRVPGPQAHSQHSSVTIATLASSFRI